MLDGVVVEFRGMVGKLGEDVEMALMDSSCPDLSNKPRMMEIHQGELKLEQISLESVLANSTRKVSALEASHTGEKVPA